jgi:hypothetical protein
MDEKPDRKRRRSGPTAVLVLVAVLVLYPLSEGPMRYFVFRGSLQQSVLNAYVPLNWVAATLAIQRYRTAYLSWWEELAFRQGDEFHCY